MKRLVLIDGHAILHRAYHALPPLTNSKGEMINAVYGFTSMLLKVVADLNPSYLIVAFDRPEPTFRNKLFKDYQIQRPKVDDEFIPQIGLVKKLVKEMGILTFEKAGFEADDVIGTIAQKTKNKKQKTEAIIVTGDRDMLQLVDDTTKIYMPVKGLSESKLYGEKEVEEKYGIKPSQIVDYKALVGDASDNYPGVAGIGPKTASSLLVRFKTLEEIFRHKAQIDSEKIKTALNDHLATAEMAKKLATIVTDVPIKVEIEKCKLPNLDNPNIHRLFEELGFRSLIPRLSGKIKKQEVRIKNREKEEKKEIKLENQQIQLF